MGRERSTSRVCNLKARDRLHSEYLSDLRRGLLSLSFSLRRKESRRESVPAVYRASDRSIPFRNGLVLAENGNAAVQRRKTETKVETRPTGREQPARVILGNM